MNLVLYYKVVYSWTAVIIYFFKSVELIAVNCIT